MNELVKRLRELRDLSGRARSSYTLALGDAAVALDTKDAEIERLKMTVEQYVRHIREVQTIEQQIIVVIKDDIERLTTELAKAKDDLAIAKYEGTKLRMIHLALGEKPIDLQEGQPGWSPEFHGVMELRKKQAAEAAGGGKMTVEEALRVADRKTHPEDFPNSNNPVVVLAREVRRLRDNSVRLALQKSKGARHSRRKGA